MILVILIHLLQLHACIFPSKLFAKVFPSATKLCLINFGYFDFCQAHIGEYFIK